MALALANRGHEVRVVTVAPHYPHWKIFPGYSAYRFTTEKGSLPPGAKGSLKTIRCPVWVPAKPRGWRRLAYLATFSLSAWPAMLKQVAWRPDVVLLVEPSLFCAPHVLAVALLSRAISWLHIQDFEVDVAAGLRDLPVFAFHDLARKIECLLLRGFDRFSTISSRMAQRLSDKGVHPARISLVPNWVDPSSIYPTRFSRFRTQLKLPPDVVVAMYSGNMGLKQGLSILAEVSAKLRHRSDIKFVFCGEGPYRGTLEAATLGHSNVITLPLQPLDQLNDLLNLADIHLLPQLEGAADLVMPSKLTGMMASGRPVIATAARGTDLASLLDGRGIATPPGDAESLAQAILQLADHPSQRKQMGLAARRYAEMYMSREPILNALETAMIEAVLVGRQSKIAPARGEGVLASPRAIKPPFSITSADD